MFMQESNPALALAGRIESVLCAPGVPPTSEITVRDLRRFSIYCNNINNMDWLPEQDSNLRPFD
jgi:hypothetical protein